MNTSSGHVCIQANYSVGEVLQLETGPRAEALDAFNLDQPPGEEICQPSLEPSGRVLNRVRQQKITLV